MGRRSGRLLPRAVLDSGAGPPAEFIERLFEPFSTTKPEGVGLGLTVARQVAESHGGRLEFSRGVGATCFELTLPAVAAEPAANDSMSEAEVATESTVPEA